MSLLSDYSADDQRLLLRSLSAAAVLIAAASPGRQVETASEGVAAASYILESRGEFLDNALIGSILFELERRSAAGEPFPSFHEAATAPGAREDALATLQAVAALMARQEDPVEALGYKQWLLRIARVTAQAGKEGGNFLGWGAVQVNETEQAALRDLADLLGVPQ